MGDEEDAGRMGNTAKREKEIKEKELRHLTGQAGRNLYLECLQLILRDQIIWLVGSRGHRAELETVVRDLWDLRTRGSGSLADDDDNNAQGEMFSSQPEEAATVKKPGEQRSKAKIWNPGQDQNWPMPRVIDTLALCYLGCLLLRTPTSIGEMCRWVNDGHMPYKRAVCRPVCLSVEFLLTFWEYYHLSREMQDRLPSTYTRALKLPLRATLQGVDLHEAVMESALSYHYNYEMMFPPVNDTVTLMNFTRQLALPGSLQVWLLHVSWANCSQSKCWSLLGFSPRFWAQLSNCQSKRLDYSFWITPRYPLLHSWLLQPNCAARLIFTSPCSRV